MLELQGMWLGYPLYLMRITQNLLVQIFISMHQNLQKNNLNNIPFLKKVVCIWKKKVCTTKGHP